MMSNAKRFVWAQPWDATRPLDAVRVEGGVPHPVDIYTMNLGDGTHVRTRLKFVDGSQAEWAPRSRVWFVLSDCSDDDDTLVIRKEG